MPSPNIIRYDTSHAYYHVYSRGIDKRPVFIDKDDYNIFLYYLKRYLSPRIDGRKSRPNFYGRIELMSYVLMSNHFHLQFYQKDRGEIAKLMKCLANSYVRYFNEKYSRIGPLFQSRYKASGLDNEAYWIYISKYIHRNPDNYRNYKYSSFPAYADNCEIVWLNKSIVLDSFSSLAKYLEYVEM